jgi:hypothetical protein
MRKTDNHHFSLTMELLESEQNGLMVPLQNVGYVMAFCNPNTHMFLHHTTLSCGQRDGTTQNISPNSDKTS